jgi:hypothetical protein
MSFAYSLIHHEILLNKRYRAILASAFERQTPFCQSVLGGHKTNLKLTPDKPQIVNTNMITVHFLAKVPLNVSNLIQ